MGLIPGRGRFPNEIFRGTEIFRADFWHGIIEIEHKTKILAENFGSYRWVNMIPGNGKGKLKFWPKFVNFTGKNKNRGGVRAHGGPL